MIQRNAALALAMVLFCCGDRDSPPDKFGDPSPEKNAEPPPEKTGELALFEGGVAMTPCPGNASAELATRIAVQLWAPAGFLRKRIVRQTRGMQSIFVGLGIRFQSADTLLSVSMSSVFSDVGTGKGAPLDRFISALAPKSRYEVQIVFVPTIVSQASAVGQGLSNLAGLTLSPFATTSENSDEWIDLLGRPLDKLPAPLIFLAIDELSKMPPELRYSVLAHEMGHVFGLSHGGGRENLMEPKRHARCLAGFNDEQVGILRTTLESSVRKTQLR